MPHRDPETGQFVASDGRTEQFDDVEVVSFTGNVGVEASNLGGGTAFSGGDTNDFEGLELIDYDEVVDRNETLHLMEAQHQLTVYSNATSTADGTVAGAAEVSASPAATDIPIRSAVTGLNAVGDESVVGGAKRDDSIDLLGRVLAAVGHSPFSDSGGGVGGGGTTGEDEVVVDGLPAAVAEFHPRDELFMNGRLTAWNIDDAGVHMSLSGQHVYGVVSD